MFFEGDMMKEVDLYSMIEKIRDKLYACKVEACEYKSIRRNAVKRTSFGHGERAELVMNKGFMQI